MTPEERFTTIENLLATVAEFQARQAEHIEKHNVALEKNSEAIRDLIVISRTLVDAQLRSAAETEKLREAQRATDEKLHILIETVDRIIRERNK